MVEIEDLYDDEDLMDAFRAFMGLTEDYQILPDDWQTHFPKFRALRHQQETPTSDL